MRYKKLKFHSLKSARGAAVLIFLTIILLAFTTTLVLSTSSLSNEQEFRQENALVMEAVSRALSGYALNQTVAGTLPCPDTDDDGIENSMPSGCVSQLGLLPYRTLQIDHFKDYSGAKLWYGVELNYVSVSPVERNSSTNVSLTLDGQKVAAVILSPGQALLTQTRTGIAVSDYLEGVNADANQDTYSSATGTTQNDQVTAIDLDSFWSLMERRVLNEVAVLLNGYRAACNEYPWAASFGGPYNSVPGLYLGQLPLLSASPAEWGSACASGTAPLPSTWLGAHWASQVYYRKCDAVTMACLTVAGTAVSPAYGIVITPGIELAGQDRSVLNVSNYYELENSSVPDTSFRGLSPIDHTDNYNDVSKPLFPIP